MDSSTCSIGILCCFRFVFSFLVVGLFGAGVDSIEKGLNWSGDLKKWGVFDKKVLLAGKFSCEFETIFIERPKKPLRIPTDQSIKMPIKTHMLFNDHFHTFPFPSTFRIPKCLNCKIPHEILVFRSKKHHKNHKKTIKIN